MATWHTSSLQQSGEGEDDEESVDAHQSSYCSTPQEVIVEEDEEFGAQAFHHDDNSEFSIALKELKSIRSHLYSAADYCESAYMYSGKKKAIFENLKDYSVKALVNAVDHIGTVAAKLDDSLVKQIKNLSVIEFNVSRTSRQFQAFHDNKNSEGLIHFQLTKRNHVYGKQYVLKDPSVHGKPNDGSSHWRIVEDSNKLENKPDQTQYDSTSDTNIPNSLAWYIASEMPSDYSVTGPYVVSRLNSTNSRGEKKLQGLLTRSFSSGQFSSPKGSHSPRVLSKVQELVESPDSTKRLTSLLSLDETRHYYDPQKHKKGLLSSFLGRTKSEKPKKLSNIVSFKQHP